MIIAEVDITQEIRDLADHMAETMPHLRNSITEMDAIGHAFVGEIATARALGATINQTYHYDLILGNNFLIDVKTKRTSALCPKSHYECSVACYNMTQRCDAYFFTRVNYERTKAWLLGFYNQIDYRPNAVLREKGWIDPDNGWETKADCYNMPICKLVQHTDYVEPVKLIDLDDNMIARLRGKFSK